MSCLRQFFFVPVVLLVLFASGGLDGQENTSAVPAITLGNRLDYIWTFGNHEPVSMYRRIGGPSTGGIPGNALWLEEWHHWFDSEACPAAMERFGLNIMHCRFYKGMGWNWESKDFPAVKTFVQNCHKHNVLALAYVQFSTLYYEIMLDEVPGLEQWAAVDRTGAKYLYGSSYFRWRPCITSPEFEEYLKRVTKIALTEGQFDGLMFDNVDAQSCYCARCRDQFRDYLARRVKDPKKELGIPSFKHVEMPPAKPMAPEVCDPVTQYWLEFRGERMTALLARLYRYALSVKGDAIVTGNVWDIRTRQKTQATAIVPTDMNQCFNLLLVQSRNSPAVKGRSVTSRVHEMKLGQYFGVPVLGLYDLDGAASSSAPYLAPFVEDAVFGGIPNDRTIMKPEPEDGFLSRERIAIRKPQIDRYRKMVADYREGLVAPPVASIYLLYSRESHMFSDASWKALYTAEEVLLHNHIPYALLPVRGDREMAIPPACKTLVVPDQRCLSDAQIASLAAFAKEGGRLVVTGRSGDFDERYRLRRANAFVKALANSPKVVCRAEAPVVDGNTPWTFAQSEESKLLPAELAKLGALETTVDVRESVYIETRENVSAQWIHFVNYDSKPVAKGTRVTFRDPKMAGRTVLFSAPLDDNAKPQTLAVDARGLVVLPAFGVYAQIRIGKN